MLFIVPIKDHFLFSIIVHEVSLQPIFKVIAAFVSSVLNSFILFPCLIKFFAFYLNSPFIKIINCILNENFKLFYIYLQYLFLS